MALGWKVVFDASDPHSQAAFWADALGYEVEDHSGLIDQLLDAGVIQEDLSLELDGRRAWRDIAAARHPEDPFDPVSGAGLGRRLLFNRVPEPKTTKNRVHLDIHAGADERDATVGRLQANGATVIREVKEQGGEWTVLADPEGNEFCVS